MKKIFGLMLLCAIMVGVTSCEKVAEDIPDVSQEVRLKLNYTFSDSGSMTRSNGSEAFVSFYDNYLKNKVLTPTRYDLIFKNIETGATARIIGDWNDEDGITLPVGEYIVSGTSNPRNHSAQLEPSSDYEFISDTVFLSFNEQVKLSAEQTSLSLNATHNSFLLLFDLKDVKKVNYSGLNDKVLNTHNNIYTIFVNRLSTRSSDIIEITKNDGKESTVSLDNIPFEKGKYYYFDDMTYSFSIPEMEEGNK